MRAAAALLMLVCAVSAQPPSPEQLFRDAVAAQQRGDDTLAIRKYQELLKLRPDILEVRANLGATLARQGRLDEAIQQYRAALAKNDNPALRLNLALAYYKKGAFSDAAAQLEPLHAADPGDARIATLLSDCDVHLGKDTQAIALLLPIEGAHPEDLGVAWILGSAQIRAGQKREGMERVEKVAQRGNSAEAYLLAGQTALKLNEFERARDDADAALKLNPKLPGALTLRGTALSYLNDTAGAITVLREALDVTPNDFDAQLALGAVLHTERDLDGARQHLERALQLNSASTLARYELARLERTEGKLEAAVKNFERVVRDDPGWPQPHVELAALYFRLNREQDGERERAVFERLSAAGSKR